MNHVSKQHSLHLLAAAFCVLAIQVRAFDVPVVMEPIDLPNSEVYRPLLMTDLPDFQVDCEMRVSKSGKVHCNGLVSTINYTEFKKREPSIKPEKLELPPELTGFKKPIPITLIRQNGTTPVPLAVVLLGFGQKDDDKIAKAWQAYLVDSGCHVLSFDSLVRPNMNEATGHGVSGNFVEEAKIAGKIVDAALALQLADGKTLRDYSTSIRLLGTSYGGLLVAQMLRSPQAKTWPVDRALILSTPISMGTAAKRLDQFAREDAPFFGIFVLAKLLGGYTPKNDHPTPREERLMRAGLGYVFHGDLQGIAKSNIERYDPELPERLKLADGKKEQKEIYEDMLASLRERQQEEMKELEAKKGSMSKDEYKQAKEELEEKHKVRETVARRKPSEIAHWNFYDYVFLLLRPYWKFKHVDSSGVTIEQLLKGAPNFVQAFVAADDPLNDPKEMSEIRGKVPTPTLQVMPHGGHLGYTGTKWVEALITRMFAPKQMTPSPK